MKKKSILIVLILILSLIPLTFAASTRSSPQIVTTLLSQTPDPVEPGQVVSVKFKIENEGKETSEDAIVRILPKQPFKIYNDVTEKNIGKLRASSTGADAAVVEFRLKVDEGAVEEDAEIELEIQFGDGSVSYTNNDFLINIQTQDAILDITSITSDPKQIAPGETAKVDIMVKNLADSLLKDIKFKLNFDDDDVPLAPYQSSSERRISLLETNFQKSLSFNIIANPDATPGLYKVPLEITYNDEKGNSYSVSDILAISVGETPKLRAYIKKSTVLQKNENGKITLEVANAGSSDVKFLEMTILPSEDYELVATSNYFYIGDVDSDDTESEEVDVFINRGVDILHFPVQLKYYDANNRPFQQQFDLEFNLYSASKLKKFGVLESSRSGLYFIIIILLIVGYFFHRSYKKNPEKYSKYEKYIQRIPFFKKKKK